MNKSQVKTEVEKIRSESAYGTSDVDCFSPWVLIQNFMISAQETMRKSSKRIKGERRVREDDFGISRYFFFG